MMHRMKILLFVTILSHQIDSEQILLVPIKLPDGSQTYIKIPFSSSRYSSSDTASCQNCFQFRTIDAGRRMLVEPCGGPNCVAMINNTRLADNDIQPSVNYDFKKCGMFDSRPFLTKALQLKVSTDVKNTLRPAEFPWLVRLESRSNIFSRTVTLCGGTLIHPQWVITAAHCMFDSKTDRLYPANGINLYMGHYDRSSTSHNELVLKPALYIIHPKFRIGRLSPAPIHDLVLIKLSKPVPLSRSIGVACLPERTDQLTDGTLAYTAGWGHASPSASPVNEPRKARIKISPKSCRQLMIDSDLHVCGRNDRGNNICSGDSGSGLMVRAGVMSTNNETKWKWHIFGVASFGLAECSQKVNHDNAFASVSAEIDWIHDVMRKY